MSGVGSTEPPRSGAPASPARERETGELLVFGRTEYAEPLTERGDAAAGEDVLATHPGPWVELVAFPRSAVHWIIRDGEDTERERRVRAVR